MSRPWRPTSGAIARIKLTDLVGFGKSITRGGEKEMAPLI